ncbi:unnamed protein product [Alternaria alternata]
MIKQSAEISSRDYILIDLRRNDHEGGTIRDSINLPAQSLHPTIPTLYTLFKNADLSDRHKEAPSFNTFMRLTNFGAF